MSSKKKKRKSVNRPKAVATPDFDKEFCLMGKKYHIRKLMLKAVATVESALDPKAYRFEKRFWEMYCANNPEWQDKVPEEVSASYGLMQIMYTTAHQWGFRRKPEDLYVPVFNIEIGTKVLRKFLDLVPEEYKVDPIFWMEAGLASYNGGRGRQIDNWKLRNQSYADKVMDIYFKLKKKEKECD